MRQLFDVVPPDRIAEIPTVVLRPVAGPSIIFDSANAVEMRQRPPPLTPRPPASCHARAVTACHVCGGTT